MAGSKPPQNPNKGILKPRNDNWRIQYSRFFSFSLLLSTSLTLLPLPSRCFKNRPFGTWFTSSSMASLHLINDDMNSGTVLVGSFPGKIYEEHHISKLIFSWPQVLYLDSCPVRVSRVVFASYRHSAGQVQKFAMCFSSSSDSQAFIDTLKAVLEDVENARHTGSELGSEMAYSSEHMSANLDQKWHLHTGSKLGSEMASSYKTY